MLEGGLPDLFFKLDELDGPASHSSGGTSDRLRTKMSSSGSRVVCKSEVEVDELGVVALEFGVGMDARVGYGGKLEEVSLFMILGSRKPMMGRYFQDFCPAADPLCFALAAFLSLTYRSLRCFHFVLTSFTANSKICLNMCYNCP